MTTITRFITTLEQFNDDIDSNNGNYYAEYSIDAKDLGLGINIKGCGDISLHKEVVSGLREAGDWSIEFKAKCKCEYCKILHEFMLSDTEISKRWPIRQDIRSHIIDVIKKLEVPIGYDVEAKGSPHKLILTKSSSIYNDAEKRFNTVCLAYQELSCQ